jgi:hypothetical protein
VVISRHDADAYPAPVRENGVRFCKYDYDYGYDWDWGIQKTSWALRLRAKIFFLTTDCTDEMDGPCIRMIRAIRGSMFVLRALCVLIAKFWKNKIAGDSSTKIPLFLVR